MRPLGFFFGGKIQKGFMIIAILNCILYFIFFILTPRREKNVLLRPCFYVVSSSGINDLA